MKSRTKLIATLSILTALSSINAYSANSSSCNMIIGHEISGDVIALGKLLTNKKTSVDCITTRLPEYNFELLKGRNGEFSGYLTLTGAGINLVEHDFKYTEAFRSEASVDFYNTLILGTGHPTKVVRLNSARLLAHVIDFDNMDILLDAINRYPDEAKKGEKAPVYLKNLLAVLEAIVPRANEDQAQKISETLKSLQSKVGTKKSITRIFLQINK